MCWLTHHVDVNVLFLPVIAGVARDESEGAVPLSASIRRVPGSLPVRSREPSCPWAVGLSSDTPVVCGWGCRLLIWRFLLQLPHNEDVYLKLVQRGTHPAFANLRQAYPVKDGRLFKHLQEYAAPLRIWLH